ncbi:amidohydrolase [Caulobacter segnis]
MTPDLSRRALLGAGGLAAGALGLTAASGQARAAAKPVAGAVYYLRNVRLETGFERDGDDIAATRTELRTLKIDKGTIAAILPVSAAIPPGATVHDAGGLLMLPSFRDMHIHLDKTFYGGPWRAPRKRKGGIAGQIQLEHKLLPEMLPTLEPRAEALVALLQGNGTTFARSQCNVDKVIGTKHVEKLKAALERHNADFGHEIVAFPQHGLVSIGLEETMRQAIRAGATHVGGIDPTAVDGGMKKSVDTMMQIALDEKAGVDIHIHEPGESGVAAINRITDITAKNPVLKDRVTISHAFSLMSLDKPAAADMAARLSAAGVSIASTVPFGGRVMPIPTLQAGGVKVFTGTDSVVDHWSVFGSGDVLEKAKLACQLYGWSDELAIGQALKIPTGGITPLSPSGEQLWPKAGDAADCVFVAAASSAEAVARLTPRQVVLHRGVVAAGAFPKRT